MAEKIVLSAEPRSDVGKGASRRLRRLAGKVPGIVYGGGKDPQNITLIHKDLVKSMEAEAFYSQVLELQLGGGSEQVILKDVQRHPARPEVMHVDFQRVLAGQKVQVNIPLHLLNEDNCKGVRLGGGRLAHHMIEVAVSCLPGALPEYFEVDVAELDVGDTLHLSDLQVPEGVELTELAHGEDHDQPIVSVEPPKGGKDSAEEEADDAAEAAGDDADEKND